MAIRFDSRDERLRRDPAVAQKLTSRSPHCGAECRRPRVLPDEHGSRTAGLQRRADVFDVLLGEQDREVAIQRTQLA
ncbi:MAG: hypothetical protein ACXVHX_38870, partial [Solirubrobacteraceae bacterium]